MEIPLFKPAIATMSLGQPGVHPLPQKLEMAAAHGFRGVELFWEDLEDYATRECVDLLVQLASATVSRVAVTGTAVHDDRSIVLTPPSTPTPEAKEPSSPTFPASGRRRDSGVSLANHTAPSPTSPTTPAPSLGLPVSYAERCHLLIGAATRLRRTHLAPLGLEVLSLQPFRNYDGDSDPGRHARRLLELEVWLAVCRRLGCRVLCIPSAILGEAEGFVGDRELIVQQLREAADLASGKEDGSFCGIPALDDEADPEHDELLDDEDDDGIYRGPITIGYENLCFGSHITTWEEAYSLVVAADRPNLLFLPDTFNICAAAVADPTSYPTGLVPDAEARWRAELARFRRTVDPARILYIQVADGERMADGRPLTPDHPWAVKGQRPLMTWSRNARCFPFEKSSGNDIGCLPLLDVLQALTDDAGSGGLAFRGWWSLEIFSRHGADPHPDTPRHRAEQAQESLERIVKALEVHGRGSCPGEVRDV